MSELEFLTTQGGTFAFQLLVATVSGLILGYERELHGSPAGIKTCSLVCVGATTYMAAGHLILEVAGLAGDPSRVAGQIVTGIGFLGAGAILRGSAGVTGLTSAATIWFIGAVGVLVGCNFPLTGLLLTLAAVVLVVGLRRLERRIFRTRRRHQVTVELAGGPEADRTRVLALLKEHGILPGEFQVTTTGGAQTLTLTPSASDDVTRQLLEDLWRLPEVRRVEQS